MRGISHQLRGLLRAGAISPAGGTIPFEPRGEH